MEEARGSSLRLRSEKGHRERGAAARGHFGLAARALPTRRASREKPSSPLRTNTRAFLGGRGQQICADDRRHAHLHHHPAVSGDNQPKSNGVPPAYAASFSFAAHSCSRLFSAA